MRKVLIASICILSLFFFSISYAVEQKETAGAKFKKFWQNLFKYPARTTEESAVVVTETGKKGIGVGTTEVKRVGEVTSGELAKTKELVVEPIQGTVETAKTAIEGTIQIPVKAAQEKAEEVK